MKMLCLSLLLAFLACSKPSLNSHGEAQLSSLFEAYWEEHSKLFPIDATSQGDNRYNDLLPNDQTPEFRETLRKHYQENLDRLLKFERHKLSANDKISYDIFKYEMQIQLQGLQLDTWKIPTQQFWGLPITLGQLGSGEQFQPFKTPQDYRNWLSRVKGFTAWTDSAIANFREGVKTRFVLPRVLVKKMIPQLSDMVVSDPTKSLFFGPINKFPATFTDVEKRELTKAYVTVIQNDIIPSYRKLRDYLKTEYLPHARSTHGISALKGGKEIYAFLVKSWTTTDKTPEEIYQTGLSEVSRIRTEMERVKQEVGFKGSLKQFFASVKKDPKLMPFKAPEDILDFFRSKQAKMQPKLMTMFGRVPKTAFEVRQTEAFRAASASAEYNPGSPDGSRPGIFYIPILDAKTFNLTSGTESLFLHEAIPGHHYQISLQQENESLPKFRRFAWYGAYGEGWALYTESLGKELGLYTDPYEYLGALGDEMHRAVRLVVDVGLHLKGWSREQAIQYMLDNQPISEEGAIAEVERYMAVPAQALSYKIGALKIRELRQKYAEQMKVKFSLSGFHDEFLKDGGMPLAVLEDKMNAWASR
jgi:uncharacterized protein (DUF885 family)